MDRSARKVQAERNRRRLPAKRRAYRWTRRIAGLLATVVFLGAGVAMALSLRPDDGGGSAVAATATATPVKEKAAKKKKSAAVKKKKKAKPKGPTKAQLAARKAAVEIVRAKGYTTLRQSGYDPKATMRVLIGRPVGDAAGGNRAFFFLKETFLGNDALGPSSKLTVVRTGKVTVTLSYGVYKPGDKPGSPSARKRVRFRLEEGRIHALDTIPFDTARFQRRQT